MVQWSIDAANEIDFESVVVVGHQELEVRESLQGQSILFARQEVPLGTGHAVLCALESLPKTAKNGEHTVLVFFGDTPLFRASTLKDLHSFHNSGQYDVTFLTAKIEEPGSYGRLVRDGKGEAMRIVEAANASDEELLINEINTGAAIFDLAWLIKHLSTFQPHPPKGEIYLTDALEVAANLGSAGAMVLIDSSEADGVNTRVDLAQATKVLQNRIIHQHQLNGVSFADPTQVTIHPAVKIGRDCWIDRGVVLTGDTVLEDNVEVGPYSVIESSNILANAWIGSHSSCVGATIHSFARVGPFARLREDSIVSEGAKVGNFVEMKKTTLGKGAKASHLTYLGDSIIGDGANIGAGTITCNYDGFSKFQTVIGKGAFIGSNTSLVAPVLIGKEAIIGAGSVITQDVPSNSIGVSRPSQKNIEGAAKRFRQRNQSH